MLKQVKVNFRSVFFLAWVGSWRTCIAHGCPVPKLGRSLYCAEHHRQDRERLLRLIDRETAKIRTRI